jgi:hypothetical protein
MKYAVVMGSDATYIPSFVKIDPGIKKLIRGIHGQQGDHISLFSFFQDKESRLTRHGRSRQGVVFQLGGGAGELRLGQTTHRRNSTLLKTASECLSFFDLSNSCKNKTA